MRGGVGVITARDAVAVVGLGLIGGGCWLVAPALALVVVGAVLLGGAVWGHYHDSPREGAGQG